MALHRLWTIFLKCDSHSSGAGRILPERPGIPTYTDERSATVDRAGPVIRLSQSHFIRLACSGIRKSHIEKSNI